MPILDTATQNPGDEEFRKIKDNMELIIKHNIYDIKIAVSLYNYFAKLAKRTFSFEMVLNF